MLHVQYVSNNTHYTLAYSQTKPVFSDLYITKVHTNGYTLHNELKRCTSCAIHDMCMRNTGHAVIMHDVSLEVL